MKIYSAYSAKTIRQRIEAAFNAHGRKNDVWVNVHNNADGDGNVLGFFLSDWDSPYADFKDYKELNYRLDNETKSTNHLNLGFNYKRLTSSDALKNN